MRLYKVTDEKGQTRNDTQWGPGVTHEAEGSPEMAGEGWLHAFRHPLDAAMLYPGVGWGVTAYERLRPRLWEVEGEPAKDYRWQVVCRKLTTIREVPMPRVAPEHRIRFAILCALATPHNASFAAWADAWLRGKDRSAASAQQIASALQRASAVFLAAKAAEWAATKVPTWQGDVAWAAATAGKAAAEFVHDIDLTALAEQAVSRKAGSHAA